MEDTPAMLDGREADYWPPQPERPVGRYSHRGVGARSVPTSRETVGQTQKRPQVIMAPIDVSSLQVAPNE
jgi:hypothetical protein